VYNNWRLELSSAVYKKSPVQRGQAMAGVSSMETLGVLGATLQAAMNALNAEVKMFNRQSANGDEDDTETVASGSSRQPRDMDVDVLACSAEDNVYATSNQREHNDSAADKITGLAKFLMSFEKLRPSSCRYNL
jgi:peroxiredoxin family protein